MKFLCIILYHKSAKKSIISNEKRCYVCHQRYNLHLHHIIFGKSRKKADKDGLVVYLCWEHHEGTNGVHGKNGHELDLKLKKQAELYWMHNYHKGEEDFIKRYGRSYL